MIALILIIAAILIFFSFKWHYFYFYKYGIPCDPPTYILGNIGPALTGKVPMTTLCEAWYKKYKEFPYLGYYKMFSPAIMARDLDLIEDILFTSSSCFDKDEIVVNKMLEEFNRRDLSQHFSESKVISYTTLMNESANEMTEFLRNIKLEEELNIKLLTLKYTTSNLMQTAFSIKNSDCFTNPNSEYLAISKLLIQPAKHSSINQIITMLFPFITEYHSVGTTSPIFEKWFLNIINKNIESRNSSTNNDDILQMLLDLPNRNEQTCRLALSLYIEGIRTSCAFMSCMLHELAQHPDIQQRCYDEIEDVLKVHANELTYDAIQDMTYMDCVFSEAARMSSQQLIGKVCTKAYALPKMSWQAEPFILQPGTVVQIPVRAIHFDPNIYPEPHNFNPSRFLKEKRLLFHKAAFLPFTDSFGMNFVVTQVKFGVISILRQFKVKPSLKNNLFLNENEIQLIFKKR